MTTIAVLGSGAVGTVLAGGLAARGHSVTIGSRDPRGRASVLRAGPPVAVAGLAEAVASAEVVVNATPGRHSVAALRPLADALDGAVLVDVANAVEQGADGFASTLVYPDTSLAEELQRTLPGTRVVKTLNTLGPAAVMADPASLPAPPSAFLSGDDRDAKATVTALLVDLGWPPGWIVDLGDITTARFTEAFVLLVRPLIHALGPVPFGLAVAH